MVSDASSLADLHTPPEVIDDNCPASRTLCVCLIGDWRLFMAGKRTTLLQLSAIQQRNSSELQCCIQSLLEAFQMHS